MVDYRSLRPNNLTSSNFRHLLLLLYWPFFGGVFWLLERGLSLNYHTVECSMDNKIPFCELFIVPYYFWFVFLFGIIAYTLFFDIPAFRKFMYFIMITYSITAIVYIVYPTMQTLRPVEFTRDNICIDILKRLYSFDTNTNVCPSLHVIGSFAVLFTKWHCERFKTLLWRIVFFIATVLISISTVFLKQHSIIDIFAALAVCIISYPISYILPDIISNKKQKNAEAEHNETSLETTTIT